MEKWARILLISLSIITAYFVFAVRDLDFDYDYEKYFPKSDDSMVHFEKFRKEYGEDSNFLLIGLENESGIFDVDFLKKVKSFGDDLNNDTVVEFIASPVHNCGYYKKAGLNGVVFKPYLDLSKSKISEQDSLRIFQNDQITGSLLSKNGKSVCLFVRTQINLNKEEASHILNLIQEKKEEYNFSSFHLAGRILAQTYFVDKMIGELVFFIATSMVLLVLFLYISFRSWWGVVIPLIVVLVSIVWTLAIMLFTGKSFDLLMVMLPTIIFVVGMSDLVHLLAKYLDELRLGKPKNEAIKVAFKEVRWATFLTSLTTAIGFFSLSFANIVPIKEFGIYAGVSVFVAYFLAFTFLPSVLVLVKPPKSLIQSEQNNFWDKYLRGWLIKVFNNRSKVIGLTVVLIGVGVYSANALKIDNYLLEDLSNSDPVKKDVIYFEENFSGLRPFEAEVTSKVTGGVFSYEFLKELEKLEVYLKNKYTNEGVGFLVSPLTVVREANFIKKGSQSKFRKLPSSKRRFEALKRQMERGAKQIGGVNLVNGFSLISADSLKCRLTGKVRDVGGFNISKENERLEDFLNENINPDILEFRLTGTAVLIDKNNKTLAKDLIFSLLFAFTIIALVVGLMFRNLKIAILSLIPNVIPLLLVTVVMFIGGIDLKISTSLIFTLAFGIAVDDTIHLLSKYKLERKKGRSHLYALKRSYLSSGKAIIVTTLILIGGFLTLLFSTFTSTYYMGLLVSVTLFFAIVFDLMVMPLIMLYGLKRKK